MNYNKVVRKMNGLNESYPSKIDEVKALMQKLGVSIDDLMAQQYDIGKFREFSNKDYISYFATNLPDGTKPLLYEGDNYFISVISGYEDDDKNIVLIFSLFSDDDYYTEQLYKITADINSALAEGNNIIPILERSKYKGRNIMFARNELISRGFISDLDYD